MERERMVWNKREGACNERGCESVRERIEGWLGGSTHARAVHTHTHTHTHTKIRTHTCQHWLIHINTNGKIN